MHDGQRVYAWIYFWVVYSVLFSSCGRFLKPHGRIGGLYSHPCRVAAAGVLPPAGRLAVLGLRSDLCCVPGRADTTEGAMDIAAAYRVASGSDRCSACFDELSLEVAAAGVQHRQLATLSRIFPGHSRESWA